jgi:hypothetical protein
LDDDFCSMCPWKRKIQAKTLRTWKLVIFVLHVQLIDCLSITVI